jgi:hypothetical protein
MRNGRAVLTAFIFLATFGVTPAAPGRADSPPKPRETWVTPDRKPEDCGWYRTADAKHWSDKMKAAAEKECYIVEEWRAFVTARQACSSDKDCGLVPSDCPFGCMNVPVAAVHATAVKKKQEDLEKKLDGRCKSKCQPVTRTVCEEGWCVGAR